MLSMVFHKLRFVFYLFLLTIIFLGVERLCHLASDGFAITRISHNISASVEAEKTVPSELTTILSQPFSYLASGAQSYVFVSQDDRYVMKFFKFHHLRIPPWIDALPTPTFLKAYKAHKVLKKETALQKTLQSYQIAHNLFSSHTALVYLHLHQTDHLHQTLHLIDKIGIHYKLDADALIFAIQQKGKPLYEGLRAYIKQGHLDQAKMIISDVLQIIFERCKQGVGDLDPDFQTNFGIIDGRVKQFDVGRFYIDSKEKDPEIYARELYRITRAFKSWLEENSPELAVYLEQELQVIQGSVIL